MNGELALVSDTINHALPHLGTCQIAYSIASQCRKARFCQAAGVMGLLLLLIHLSGRGRTLAQAAAAVWSLILVFYLHPTLLYMELGAHH